MLVLFRTHLRETLCRSLELSTLSLSLFLLFFFFTIKIPLSNGETQLQGNEVGCEADGVENYYSTKAHKIPML